MGGSQNGRAARRGSGSPRERTGRSVKQDSNSGFSAQNSVVAWMNTSMLNFRSPERGRALIDQVPPSGSEPRYTQMGRSEEEEGKDGLRCSAIVRASRIQVHPPFYIKTQSSLKGRNI